MRVQLRQTAAPRGAARAGPARAHRSVAHAHVRAMIRQHGTAVRVTIRAQPRASRTEVMGVHGDAIRVRIAAPPVEGAANRELLHFIARRLGVPQAAVRLAGGGSGRNKIVEIDDADAAVVRRALLD